MTWRAPVVTNVPPPWVADERGALIGWLEHHRQTLLHKCEGLTAEDLRRRAVPPSSLSLLGLVRHLTDVERTWFRIRVAGEQIPSIYWSDDPAADPDFDDVDDADPAVAFAAYDEEVDVARAVLERHADLDEVFVARRRGGDEIRFDLRGLLVHMIEEYARHNGHADLLRECLDGTTDA